MRTVKFVRSTVALLTAATLTGMAGRGFAEEKAAPKAEVVWKQIGDAAGVTILAGAKGKLFAATKSGKLMMCEPQAPK